MIASRTPAITSPWLRSSPWPCQALFRSVEYDEMRTLELDDELATLLEQDQPLEKAARETLVLGLFRRGRISTGKACELLGLSRLEFIREAAQLGFPVDLTTEDEWEADRATIDGWPKS